MASFIPGLIGAGMGIYGNIMDERQRQWMQGAQVDALNWNRGQHGIGQENYWNFANPYRSSMLDMLQWGGQGAFGNEGSPGSVNFMRDFVMNQMGGMNPGMFNYNNLSPGNEEDINNYQAIMSRVDPFYSPLYDMVNNGGRNYDMQFGMDRYNDMIMGGGPFSNQRNIGSEIFNNRGQTASGNVMQDRMVDAFNYGGSTPTTGGMQGSAFNFLNMAGQRPQDGFTPFAQQMGNTGFNLLNERLSPTQFQQGAFGNANNLLSNPYNSGGQFDQMSNFFLNNSGPTSQINDLSRVSNAAADQALTSGGYTPGLQQVSGNAQNLFDTMMSTGGYTPQSNNVINTGLGLINSAGAVDPMISSLFSMGSSMMGGGGISASRPTYQAPTGDGSTEWTNYLRDRARGIYDGSESPLLSMDANISMARDQGANLTTAAAQQAYRQAAQRGLTGASNVVGGGNTGRILSDFQGEILGQQAQGLRDAAFRRQELGLQERGQADQLGLGIAGAENQRYGTDVNAAVNRYATDAGMYNNELSNQTSRMSAGANAAAAAASARASMYGSALGAGSNLALGGLNDATSRFNTGTGNALQSQLSAENIASGRYLGGLNAGITGLTNAANATNDRFGTAGQLAIGAGGLANQRGATNIGAGVNLYGIANNSQQQQYGTNMNATLPFLSGINNNETNRFGIMNQTNLGYGNLANNLFGTSMGNEIDRLNMYGNYGNRAADRELDRLGLGMQFDMNAGNGYMNALGNYMGLNQQGINNMFGGMNMGMNLGNYQGNMMGNIQGVRNNNYNQNRGSYNDYWDVMGGMMNQGNNIANRDLSVLFAGQNGLGSMAGDWLDYSRQFGMANPFSNQQIPQSNYGQMFRGIGSAFGSLAQQIPWLNGSRGRGNVNMSPQDQLIYSQIGIPW